MKSKINSRINHCRDLLGATRYGMSIFLASRAMTDDNCLTANCGGESGLSDKNATRRMRVKINMVKDRVC